MLGVIMFGWVAAGVLYMVFDDDDDDDNDKGSEQPPGGPEQGDLIEGTDGPDRIEGTPGPDRIFAAGGDDIVTADDGADRVFADTGEDVVLGEGGDDFLRGGAQDDLILPGAGLDTVFGDTGDDLIDGIDVIDEQGVIELAENGDLDTVDPVDLVDFDKATDEADTLNGGVGEDFILFGSNDEVSGGDNADTLVTGYWTTPSHPATVTDFEPAEDVLVYGFEGDAIPFIAFGEENGDAVLQVDGQTVVRLPGVQLQDLGPDNLFLQGIPLPNQI